MYVKKQNAFTMMEIMVVLGLIMFLLAFIVPRVVKYNKDSRKGQTVIKINALKEAIMNYQNDIGHAPKKAEGGLDALLTRPNAKEVAENWKNGPYVKDEKALQDSWNNSFEYNNPPVKNKQYRVYEIISQGPEGEDNPIVDGE